MLGITTRVCPGNANSVDQRHRIECPRGGARLGSPVPAQSAPRYAPGVQRIGSAAADLGLLALVIVGGVALIAIVPVAMEIGGNALFGPPDPATQMSQEEIALANRLDRGGWDVDYVDFESDQITVYLRDVRGEQIFEACRFVRDDYDLSASYSGPVDVQVALGRDAMSARISSERGDC